MSKTVPGALATHIARPVTTLCTCFEVTRKDGEVLRFTDHDQNLTVDGDVYLAAVGYDRTQVANSAGANVDNVEVQFVSFKSGAITQTDIRAGLYDYASVRMFVVNWANPSDGALSLRQGFIGELTLTQSGIGKGELRGLAQVFARKTIRVYTPDCPWDFGDSRCRFDLDQVRVTGVVTAVSNDRRTFQATLSGIGSPSSLPAALHAGYFSGGSLEFTSGDNAGKSYEIREQLDGIGSPSVGPPQFTLYLATPYDIEVGHAFEAVPACDKQFATCRDTWHNTINFGGQPHVPGADRLMNVTMPGDS